MISTEHILYNWDVPQMKKELKWDLQFICNTKQYEPGQTCTVWRRP